jgi:hypothetical protein
MIQDLDAVEIYTRIARQSANLLLVTYNRDLCNPITHTPLCRLKGSYVFAFRQNNVLSIGSGSFANLL